MSLTKGYAKPPKIRWDIDGDDEDLIHRIVERAKTEWPEINPTDSIMDLTATHLNGCPLKLKEFLKADAGNFGHDFFGIRRYLDRETGKLTDCFLPRFYDSKAVKRG